MRAERLPKSGECGLAATFLNRLMVSGTVLRIAYSDDVNTQGIFGVLTCVVFHKLPEGTKNTDNAHTDAAINMQNV